MRREGEHHRERRDDDESEGDPRRDPCRREHPGVAPPRRVDRRTRTPERKEDRRAESGRAEVAGAHGAVRCAGVAPAFGAV